jgi:hypothetical protein
MNDGVRELIGKTVQHVVVAQGTRHQVFLVFTDGTYFEFYGQQFRGTGGVDSGGLEAALAYVRTCESEVRAVY